MCSFSYSLIGYTCSLVFHLCCLVAIFGLLLQITSMSFSVSKLLPPGLWFFLISLHDSLVWNSSLCVLLLCVLCEIIFVLPLLSFHFLLFFVSWIHQWTYPCKFQFQHHCLYLLIIPGTGFKPMLNFHRYHLSPLFRTITFPSLQFSFLVPLESQAYIAVSLPGYLLWLQISILIFHEELCQRFSEVCVHIVSLLKSFYIISGTVRR